MVLGIIRCHCRNVQVLSRRVRLCRADRITSTSRNGIAKHLLGTVRLCAKNYSPEFIHFIHDTQIIASDFASTDKERSRSSRSSRSHKYPHIYRASEAVDMRSSSSGRPSNLKAYSQKHSSLASRNGATPHFHHVYICLSCRVRCSGSNPSSFTNIYCNGVIGLMSAWQGMDSCFELRCSGTRRQR